MKSTMKWTACVLVCALCACGAGGLAAGPSDGGVDAGLAAPSDGGHDDGGVSDGGRPVCDTIERWQNATCQRALLEEAGYEGYTACGLAGEQTVAQVSAACPMAAQMSLFRFPPPPPFMAIPLRCEAELGISTHVDFYCKGTGPNRRVVSFMRDRVRGPPPGPTVLWDVFATGYIEAGNTGGTTSALRVLQSVENNAAVLDFVTVYQTLPQTVVKRVFQFSSRTIMLQNNMPVLGPVLLGWVGLAEYTTPQ